MINEEARLEVVATRQTQPREEKRKIEGETERAKERRWGSVKDKVEGGGEIE